jgi:hypothetical protein
VDKLESVDDWIWCGKCERAYRLSHARNNWFRNLTPEERQRLGKGHETRLSGILCTYEDCHASFLSNGLRWRSFRVHFPELKSPTTPRYGQSYPVEASKQQPNPKKVPAPAADSARANLSGGSAAIPQTNVVSSGRTTTNVENLRSTPAPAKPRQTKKTSKSTKSVTFAVLDSRTCPICKASDPGGDEHCRYCNAYIGKVEKPEKRINTCQRCGRSSFSTMCDKCREEMKHPYDGHRLKGNWWDDD